MHFAQLEKESKRRGSWKQAVCSSILLGSPCRITINRDLLQPVFVHHFIASVPDAQAIHHHHIFTLVQLVIMADYRSKGALSFSTGGKGRLLSKFQFWGTPSNGTDAVDHKWANSSNFLATKADQDAVRDHVCRPVIFGSDGKAKPVIFDSSRRHHMDDGAKQAAGSGAYRVDTSYRPPEFAGNNGRSSAAGFYGSVEATLEPTMINTGGWTRQSRAGWAMPPDVPLEKATNPRYMDSAVQFPAAGSQSYASNPNKSSSVAVIDSREAAKKYGGQFTW